MTRWMIAFVALTGCSAETLLETAYPDRERFQFLSNDGETMMFYACEPGPDAATRARQAHDFFEANLDALADQAAEGFIARSEAGQGNIGNAISMNNELNVNVDVIVKQSEARFQCLFYDDQPI